MSDAPPLPPVLDDLIAVARIARPQGLRGEVMADLLTDFPERFAALKDVRLATPQGVLELRQLESSRLQQGRVVLKFKGCDTRNEAEGLRDARVLVTRAQLVKLPVDTFYDFDLIGCAVSTTGGQPLGQVTAVQNYGAAPLLAVQNEGRELLIPLARGICVEIDLQQKRIVVDPPEGLLDL
jgi:16S rRNA processing protein RimM